ncbi:MAG: hypothetical protein V3S89_15355 [Desulfobacterales bacterium]
MRRIITSIVICMAIFLAVPVNAAEKTVEVEGISFISKADAIRQAQRAAVEQAVGVFIHSQTEVENFAVKKDKILSRTQGYVTRFTVLNAKTESDNTFTVSIRAVISLDKIKDDLMAMRILLDSMAHPKVMILIEERYVSMDDIGMRLAETELSSLLGAKGFDLVDQAQLAQITATDQSRQALAGNMAAAQSIGLNVGAQYVILGRATVQDSGEAFPGSGMKSIQASMQVKILQTQSGRVLGSVVKNGVAAHISPLTGATKALRIAVKKAVDDYVVDTITNSFQDYLNNGAPLKAHITGVGSFKLYKRVVDAIDRVDRVVSSKKEGWNKAGGILILDLRFKGTSEELAEMLDGLDIDGYQLEVVDLAPDRIDCNLK